MADPTYSFSNLFTYVTDKGIVVPDTSKVKENVENAFKEKWGANINLAPETLVGRLVEGITMLIVNVIGVNALNANSLNVTTAVGAWLDNIGRLFGLDRFTDETDELYRKRILSSNSRGKGFAASISNAISGVNDVTHVCVLDNGNADPTVIDGMSVNAHSVFIAVAGGEDDAIANAIYTTKSLGCAYHLPSENEQIGEQKKVEIKDNANNTITKVTFYRPVEIPFKLTADIIDDVYTGSDIVVSVKNAIVEFLKKHTINTVVTKGEIMAAIAQNSGGAVCSSLTIERGIVSNGETTWGDEDTITLLPYEYANVTSSNITVNVT
jgi:hypothetical protein